MGTFMNSATNALEAARNNGWTGRMWSDIQGTYSAILEHPFMGDLVSGDLPLDTFRHYIIQDELYIREYAKGISVLAGKAPTWHATQLFAEHAVSAAKYESEMHDSIVGDLGGNPSSLDDAAPTPTSLAYISFIRGHVNGSSFVDGLAAILPCFWIYAEVGRHLAQAGSKNAAYQKWIDSYEDPAYVDAVLGTLEVTNNLGNELGPADEIRARNIFRTGAKYEWMFWDAAFRRETWPI